MTKIQAYHNIRFNSKFKANRGWCLLFGVVPNLHDSWLSEAQENS
jgi:hypothetical protein